MKAYEKFELAFILLAVAAVGLAGRFLPSRLSAGALLTMACLLWMVQGGVRDVWLVYRLKSRPSVTSKRKLACMCLESSAGLTGVLVGISLALFGVGGPVALTPGRWMLMTAGVLIFGFLAKDFVISWHPLGLRREPDHHTIIFTWW